MYNMVSTPHTPPTRHSLTKPNTNMSATVSCVRPRRTMSLQPRPAVHISDYIYLSRPLFRITMPSQPPQSLLFVSTPLTKLTSSSTATAPLLSTRRARSSSRSSVKTNSRIRMIAKPDSLGLPAALRKYVDSFALVPDPKLRYQQLLYLARQLPKMDSSLKVDENRVRGCTSIVHVHVSLDKQNLVRLQGDSDAQLTKGLLALLVNGLDGSTPQQVASVDPDFISVSGLSVSLTPSRNNGFVNMLAKIKQNVAKLALGETEADAGAQEEPESQLPDDPDRPVYSAIMRKLDALKPTRLEVRDDSAQHARHEGARGFNGESHFSVSIVSNAFDSLALVQRHRLIYTLLAEEMSSGYIHALQIDAKTPEEVA